MSSLAELKDRYGPIVATVVPPFFEEGAKQVFIARCCNRLFVSINRPGICRTCGNVPQADILRKEDF